MNDGNTRDANLDRDVDRSTGGSRPIDRRGLLKRGAAGVGAATLGVASFSGEALAGCKGDHECARTIGFWKNHTDMWHGNGHLHFGTERDTSDRHEYFSRYEGRKSVLEILEAKPKGDKSIILAKQFIAARLNMRAGVESSCIEEDIRKAREWFDDYGVCSGQRRWRGGESIKDRLDRYNNGKLCACGAD